MKAVRKDYSMVVEWGSLKVDYSVVQKDFELADLMALKKGILKVAQKAAR